MEAEIAKVKELQEMGFIQADDAAERINEIRAKYGAAPAAATTSANSSSTASSTSYASSSYYEQPAPTPTSSYSYSAPEASPSYSTPSYGYAASEPTYVAPQSPPPQQSYTIAPVQSTYDLPLNVAPQQSNSPIEWDSSVTVKSSELTLEASNKSVINKGNSSGSLNIVRAKTGFSSGKHTWQIRINSVPSGQGWVFAIGICRGDVNKNMYVGGGGNGWAFLSNGQKLFSNAFLKYDGKGYSVGDVIGVTVDFDTTELRFSRNDQDLGVAFRGISGFVYPAVTVPGPDKGPLSKQFGSITII